MASSSCFGRDADDILSLEKTGVEIDQKLNEITKDHARKTEINMTNPKKNTFRDEITEKSPKNP
jgi:hypothetical protein